MKLPGIRSPESVDQAPEVTMRGASLPGGRRLAGHRSPVPSRSPAAREHGGRAIGGAVRGGGRRHRRSHVCRAGSWARAPPLPDSANRGTGCCGWSPWVVGLPASATPLRCTAGLEAERETATSGQLAALGAPGALGAEVGGTLRSGLLER